MIEKQTQGRLSPPGSALADPVLGRVKAEGSALLSPSSGHTTGLLTPVPPPPMAATQLRQKGGKASG